MNQKMFCKFLVVLGIMLICSAVLLAVLSMIIWKMDGNGGVLCAGVMLTYVLSSMLGGFLMGKMMGKQKFFWGVMAGLMYFLVLLVTGVCLLDIRINGNMQLVSGGLACVISGMLGGMFAPGKEKK